ncbi:2-dehydro-3-deoxyphosphogluconate aldolase / (4S)-4-hydroxy-2-oxoglutarate aldolase [Lachnospiraceae bacterium KH1T2]|nr:2-dehydro-3-deoxyphosphogluconate aldolase / (4S)-4-hydroxy-2-oxoglutarate aldolase [Lachnospiraceae bacterium KH1T2]
MDKVLERLSDFGVVPVVVLNRSENAAALADALCEAGLACAEVTFRTEAAGESIRAMKAAHPKMLIGAGTVLTTAQVDMAISCGAEFIVAPGFDPEVVDYCLEKKITVVPGCVTPSEVAQGVNRGLEVLKFFPAEQAGGLPMIKAMAAPYTNVKFMPTGGINENNLADYLECSKIVCCGGSWFVKSDLIENGSFDKIKEKARKAVNIVRSVRLEKAGKVG